MKDTTAARQSIIDGCLWMGQVGLNQGTSGNMEMIVKLPLSGAPSPDQNPSTEWHFHQAVYQTRPDVKAVVHAHPAHATAIAIQRRAIPAVHYMIAAFGGADVPCAGYARYGTVALSEHVTSVVQDRDGCLMANHGALTLGASLDKALWRMQELENLARVMLLAEQSGTPFILSDDEIADTLDGFGSYGLRAAPKTDER